MAQVQIQRVSHRHEFIIDWLLANPDSKNMQPLCDLLGVTRPWLSIVMNSKSFRVEYERRRQEYNERHAATVQKKLFEASIIAIEKVKDALQDDEVDPRFALDTADKMTAKLGFAPNRTTSAPVVELTQNVQVVDRDLLESARRKMGRILEGQASEVGRQDHALVPAEG